MKKRAGPEPPDRAARYCQSADTAIRARLPDTGPENAESTERLPLPSCRDNLPGNGDLTKKTPVMVE